MIHRFSREEQLIGAQGLQKLRAARVAVFGAGGVGGYTIEALARCGVGSLTIVDGDSVSLTNINRQILALEGHPGPSQSGSGSGAGAPDQPGVPGGGKGPVLHPGGWV